MELQVNYSNRGGIYCAAQFCNSCTRGGTPQNLSFHTFPKDEQRCQEWLRRIGRSDLMKRSAEQLYGSYRLCSNHFSDDTFMNVSSKKRRLVWNALPTRNLSPDYIAEKQDVAKLLLADLGYVASSDQQSSEERSIDISDMGDGQVTESSSSTLKLKKSKNTLHIKSIKKILNDEFDDESEDMPDELPNFPSVKVSRRLPAHLRKKEESKAYEVYFEGGELLVDKKPQFSSIQDFPDYSTEESDSAPNVHVLNYRQANILKSLSDLNEKAKDGWTEQVKETSFILYHRCSREYEFLSSFFSLPPLHILQDWVSSLFTGTGFQKEVFIGMQHRLSMLKGSERMCTLSLRELALTKELFYSSKSDHLSGLVDYGNFGKVRRAADSAVVLIASGIYKRWSQPVGYFLKEKKKYRILKHLILECLTKLSEIDLDIKVLVCRPSKVNKLLFRDLGVNEHCPYFRHNEMKIFCMFDPSSLRVSVGNTLKKKDICFGKKVCKWEYVKEFYKFNSNMVENFSLQIEKDSAVSSTEKISLSHCFSKPVAAGIHALGVFGRSKGAEETGEFLGKIHDLYAVFDTYSDDPHLLKPKEYARELEHIRELLKWIKLWKIHGTDEPMTCQDDWSITLSCVLQLFEEMKGQFNSCRIIARRLNQSSLRYEDFGFKKEKLTGKEVTPNVQKFDKAYKAYLKKSLFQPVEKLKVNNDILQFFSGYEEIMKMSKGMSVESMYSYHHLEECEKADLPQANRLAFIAVNIIRKVRLVVFCKKCLGELIQEKVVYETKDQPLQSQNKAKKKGPQKKVPQKKAPQEKTSRTMIAPHKKLLKIMPKLESSFLFAFQNMYHMPRVKMKIHHFMYKDVCNEFADMNIDCEEVKKIVIGLFINISLDHIIPMLSLSEGKIVIPDHL